jgi:hypothetical protein
LWVPSEPAVRVGDLITFPLGASEGHVEHVTGVKKWTPRSSLPYRVTAVHPNSVEAVPLWTVGPPRSVPRSQVSQLQAFTPAALKDLVSRLVKAPVPGRLVRDRIALSPEPTAAAPAPWLKGNS